MKKQHVLSFLIIVILLTFACKEKPKTAFDEYGDALIDSYKKAQKTETITNLDTIKKAILIYHAEKGKYPESLGDINEYLKSEIDLSKYNYDSNTGNVSLKEE